MINSYKKNIGNRVIITTMQKAQQTIKKGTSQDTLLINRLFALEVSLSL